MLMEVRELDHEPVLGSSQNATLRRHPEHLGGWWFTMLHIGDRLLRLAAARHRLAVARHDCVGRVVIVMVVLAASVA